MSPARSSAGWSLVLRIGWMPGPVGPLSSGARSFDRGRHARTGCCMTAPRSPKTHSSYELLEMESKNPVGRVVQRRRASDHRQAMKQEALAAGHLPRSATDAIRAHCIDCSGDNRAEADRCTVTSCNLWPFRFGRNLWSERRMSPEQKEAAAARLERARAAKKRSRPSSGEEIEAADGVSRSGEPRDEEQSAHQDS